MNEDAETPNDSRFERGQRTLDHIHGETGQGFVEHLGEFAPDFARLLVEFPFGDIYSRPGLDLKSRQIATIAALTVMGDARRELEIHIKGAIRVGCTRQEIIELIMQMAVYAGFPAALHAMAAARTVFEVEGKAA